MQFRKATWEDLEAINEIYNQAVEQRFCTAHLEPVGMEYRREWFAQHDPEKYPVFVACQSKEITGWVSLGPYRLGRQALAHVGEVSYYVERGHRGRGTGSLLMEHAMKKAPDFGLTVLVAILLNRNPPSMALLKKFGFSEWGVMPGIARISHDSADHLYYGLKL